MYLITEPKTEEEILAATVECATGDQIKIDLQMKVNTTGYGFDSQCK
jgi:hypothetical protein